MELASRRVLPNSLLRASSRGQQVYLYDLDGSFARAPFVRALRQRGRLVYEASLGRAQPLPEIFAKYGTEVSTANLAETLTQHHCWQQARHNADWVISINHAWDMLLFSPVGESLDDLLTRLPQDQVSYVEGVRYGPGVGEKANQHANVLGRFPFHLDPILPSQHFQVPEERVVIAPPQLVDGAVLSEVAPRQDGPLWSNLIGDRWKRHPTTPRAGCRSKEFCPFSGRLMTGSNVVDTAAWRANHYVQLFGSRTTLYKAEEATKELRNFVFYDHAAALLGDRLATPA